MLNDVTRAFFTGTATIETPEIGRRDARDRRQPERRQGQRQRSPRDPRYRSMLRTTCVATMLSGGHARNALPQTATANVNCRMAPGHDPEDVRAALLKAANDTGVKISKRTDDGTCRAVAAVARDHATDREGHPRRLRSERARDSDDGHRRDRQQVSPRRREFRATACRGLIGDPNDARAHGKDERVLIKSYYDSEEFLYRLVKEMSSAEKLFRETSRLCAFAGVHSAAASAQPSARRDDAWRDTTHHTADFVTVQREREAALSRLRRQRTAARLPRGARQHGPRVRRFRAGVHRSLSRRRDHAPRLRRVRPSGSRLRHAAPRRRHSRRCSTVCSSTRASFIGHSIAGEEMTRFGVTYPARVDKLVYLDGAYDRVRAAHADHRRLGSRTARRSGRGADDGRYVERSGVRRRTSTAAAA